MSRFPVDLSALVNMRVDSVARAIETEVGAAVDRGEPVCTCMTCLLDIAAIALNSLPPEYVSDPWMRFPESPETAAATSAKVRHAVREALATVSARPHHER